MRFRRGRRRRRVRIEYIPCIFQFMPIPAISDEVIYLDLDELEALRLVDYEGLKFDEAAERLKCSKAKVWRLVNSGRKKLIDAVINGKILLIKKEVKDITMEQ